MIWLLRHGRTEANARGLLLGRADPDLDGEGHRQAEALASAVAKQAAPVDRVVSSPLRRCRTTAEVVADAVGVPVLVDERWIELDYGELEGTPLRSLPQETLSAWREDPAWAPPDGESLADLGSRVRGACEELVGPAVPASDAGGRGDGGDVVVVSHVSPIKAAVAWVLDVEGDVAWRLFLRPASITRVSTAAGRRSLHSFNETAHLR